ncbi:kinase-like domain-containing protein [Pisolithus marmoratus]|nr:kinase-like domain-containing protein [Pisolithus marmoratus]
MPLVRNSHLLSGYQWFSSTEYPKEQREFLRNMARGNDGVTAKLGRLLRRAGLCLSLLLTLPNNEYEPRTYVFRFGIPLVMKVTHRTVSTEADALRYLNKVAPRLPIPKLLGSFELNGKVYTIMTKLPGRRLLDTWPQISAKQCTDIIVKEVTAILYQLWDISQPVEIKGKSLGGPYSSTLECYDSMSDTRMSNFSPGISTALMRDPIVWVHTDLRMQNVLVDDEGHVTGIVDWEDSGWLPRHWQLHILRRPQWGCMGAWVVHWQSEFRCDDVTEEAYNASLDGVLVYPL